LGAAERKDVEVASQSVRQRLDARTAHDPGEIEAPFATLRQRSIGALIAVDTLYYEQMRRMAELAIRHAIPAISPLRDFADAGGS
jgi:putative ABC transport system substrate-binding protein